MNAVPVSLLEALREAILTGRYAPGTRLIQEDVAAAFGISRIPLREALNRLEGEGLVINSRYRGATVRPLVPKDVVDLYDLRLALESLALRRAAERAVDVRDQTRTRHRQAARALADGAFPALFHLDRDFHAELAAGSDNPHLVDTLGSQWSQIMRLMHAFLSALDYPPDIWHEHESIADAVAAGDAERAVFHLEGHLLGSRDLILSRLTGVEGSGTLG